MSKPIEVCILTGYLGAGKTTLLNHLLCSLKHRNVFVIENELGELPIDGAFIQHKQTQMIELTHGCICCTLDSELEDTLWEIVQNKSDVDLLLIEATGTADSGSIGALFMQPAIRKHFDLLSCVCVVDAESFEHRLQHTDETGKQLAFATDVVINKTEFVTLEYADQLSNIIRKINPFAEISQTAYGSVSTSDLLHPKIRNNQFSKPDHTHSHTHDVEAIPYTTTQRCDMDELNYCLRSLLFLYNHQIYRVKGIVRGQDNHMYLVQSAGKHITMTKLSEWGNTPQETRLVVIGNGITEKTIRRLLRKPFAQKGLKADP